ncbi:MAG: tetratricopeptide repeat protein, partial [Bacteroidales bacterium]|nr:tetratricopeptide repeat protein [Bacteroidales bacterium]
YAEGVMHSLDQLGVMERNMSNLAQAQYFHKRCLALAEAQHAENWLMRSAINLGVVYSRINEYESALQYFFLAFPLAEKLKNEREIASCLGNIGNLYLSLNKLDEAMDYFRKSLNKAKELNNYQGLAISHGSMGRVFENRNMLDSAQYYYERNLYYAAGWNDDNGIAISYSSLGNVAKKRGDGEKALEYHRKALEISLKVGDRNYIAPNYARLGDSYLQVGNMELAETNYLQSLQIAQQTGLKRHMITALGGLSELYELQNRHIEALQLSRRQIDLRDSVLNEENLRRIEFLKISFEVEQKELQITSLETENRLLSAEKRLIILLGVAVLLLVLAALVLMIQKRQLAMQKIKQLEQEKQLVATQAVLDGEVQERTRIARDLHDGLGSMLTGSKMNIENLKNDLLHGALDVTRCNNALTLLNDSAQELRRIAHHLMPDSLARFGLKTAVGDFCNVLPNVSFSWYGNDTRLEPKIETMIYRTLYELVNNSLKHARASQILVQIIQEPARIAFTVQDNGCGFDPSAVLQGTGLQNIRTRVASFGGIMNMVSSDEGTETNVELRIEL